VQSLQPAVTRALQHVVCGHDVGKISSTGCLVHNDRVTLSFVKIVKSQNSYSTKYNLEALGYTVAEDLLSEKAAKKF